VEEVETAVAMGGICPIAITIARLLMLLHHRIRVTRADIAASKAIQTGMATFRVVLVSILRPPLGTEEGITQAEGITQYDLTLIPTIPRPSGTETGEVAIKGEGVATLSRTHIPLAEEEAGPGMAEVTAMALMVDIVVLRTDTRGEGTASTDISHLVEDAVEAGGINPSWPNLSIYMMHLLAVYTHNI